MDEEKFLRIDGSYGEGGGQILRTSLSLSSILKRPIIIENIRRGRKVPGLRSQHLTSVRAASLISGASLEGDKLGSTHLVFQPGKIKSGQFNFDVAEERGSAGSVSLVLQTLLLPLTFSKESSEIEVRGGTHVNWSPPVHYLEHIFLPMVGQLGCHFEIHLERWGWYPRGGGCIRAKTFPSQELSGLRVTEKGKLIRLTGVSAVGNLPLEIAQRQKATAENILKKLPIDCPLEIDLVQVKPPQPVGAGSEPAPTSTPSRGEGTSGNLLNIPSPPRIGGEGQGEGVKREFLYDQVNPFTSFGSREARKHGKLETSGPPSFSTSQLPSFKGVGQGTLFFLLAEYENVRAGFSSLGARGKRAETVAEEACQSFQEHFRSTGALDPHLADQLIPYLALSQQDSLFTTSRIDNHLLTNLWCVKQFLPLDIEVKGELGSEGEISIKPRMYLQNS